MNRNQRRLAHDLKRSGLATCVPAPRNLAAAWTGLEASDLELSQPTPGICIHCSVCGGPCAPADNGLCNACRGLARTFELRAQQL